MRCLEAFRCNTNGVKHPRNITSHVHLSRNFSGEKYDQARENPKMSQKQPTLKVIIHAFGFSRGPSSERYGISLRDMIRHRKGVMWLGTNMWVPLCSFRGNLGFTRNEQMWCYRLFEAMQIVPKNRATLQVTSALPKKFLVKI